MGVELALEVEGALFVGDITRNDQEGECDPCEEGVPSEEAAVVEEDASPANDGGENADRSSEGREDELLAVASVDDIGVVPDIEPGKETNDKGSQRIKGHLGCVSSAKSKIEKERTRVFITNRIQLNLFQHNRFFPRLSWQYDISEVSN